MGFGTTARRTALFVERTGLAARRTDRGTSNRVRNPIITPLFGAKRADEKRVGAVSAARQPINTVPRILLLIIGWPETASGRLPSPRRGYLQLADRLDDLVDLARLSGPTF